MEDTFKGKRVPVFQHNYSHACGQSACMLVQQNVLSGKNQTVKFIAKSRNKYTVVHCQLYIRRLKAESNCQERYPSILPFLNSHFIFHRSTTINPHVQCTHVLFAQDRPDSASTHHHIQSDQTCVSKAITLYILRRFLCLRLLNKWNIKLFE